MDEASSRFGSKLVTAIYTFILITIVKPADSQPSDTDICTLNIGSLYNSTCEEGSWGGFLNNDCCGAPFNGYLYALALRANQTGQIYLNPTEQRVCLAVIKNSGQDISGCGIEKLTSGGGDCSDLSVNDVTGTFGDKVKGLKGSCEFRGSVGEWNQSCGSCVRRWEEMKGLHSKNSESTDIESDICRFAVLVSLMSTQIEDVVWVREIFRCLGEQADDKVSHSLPKESGNLKVSIKEVYSATDNLNEMNFIGEGTAGKVYKGKLSNSQDVAVKHIINDGFVETFLREVRSLAHVRHPNLVALLGYSENGDECFLIYELCTNGNLSEWLFGKDKALSWIQRLHVAIDSARGLWFLHTYPQGCIVHRDIKPTNILLGRNFEAKLSDFGLSKVIDLGETYASSEVRGTFGYVDPEYQNNRQVKAAGDVYSFGIVLLQLLSGRRVINMNVKKPMPIDKMAKSLTKDSSIVAFADPKLEGEHSEAAFELAFKLALSCISLEQQRPSMEQVVVKLDEAIEISTKARASTPYATP
ncbi:hypothetical protein LguiB_008804 [Lonicera macranthoides]